MREPFDELPLGVVLAGGRGRRLGGAKAAAELGGRPLVSYALDALRAVLPEVVLSAKAGTALPGGLGAEVWREPAEPVHPLFGLVWALERAGGRAVVCCAADLPLVSAESVARVAGAPGAVAVVAVPAGGGAAQPLLGRYGPGALEPLAAALTADPGVALRAAVAALAPGCVEVPPGELLNVNTAADLERAAGLLQREL